MDQTSLLKKYKTTLIKFIDDLMIQFPEEGELIIGRVLIKDQIPIEQILDSMTERLLPYIPKIKSRDEAFFLNEDDVFSGLDVGKTIKFKKIWKSARLSTEDRDAIWKWIDLLVRFAKINDKMFPDKFKHIKGSLYNE